MTLYLAGAIRDDHPEDITWREELIERIATLSEDVYNDVLPIRILNPLANKTFNLTTKEWRVGGIRTESKHIVAQDLWCVRQADIIVANFSSLTTGYPSIGTVMEVGAAAGIGGKLIYSIIDPAFSGHTNPGVFRLHPFLAEVSSQVFATERDCLNFLISHLPALCGLEPSFAGVVEV